MERGSKRLWRWRWRKSDWRRGQCERMWNNNRRWIRWQDDEIRCEENFSPYSRCGWRSLSSTGEDIVHTSIHERERLTGKRVGEMGCIQFEGSHRSMSFTDASEKAEEHRKRKGGKRVKNLGRIPMRWVRTRILSHAQYTQDISFPILPLKDRRSRPMSTVYEERRRMYQTYYRKTRKEMTTERKGVSSLTWCP